MKKISVIIPTYQPDYYIWECLESIKNQTLDRELFEVLIILNKDKEPYYTQINNYILRNNLDNFKLFYTSEKGVSNARNIGLDKAKGNYIAFLDDDDCFSIDYLKFFFEVLEENTLNIANIQDFIENNKFIKTLNYKCSKKTSKLILHRKSFSCIGGKIIPVNIIQNIRFNKKYKNGEDSLFMVQISKNIEFIQTGSEKTIYWRRLREDSAGNKKQNIDYILRNGMSLLREYFKLLWNDEYNIFLILIEILAVLKGMLYNLIR